MFTLAVENTVEVPVNFTIKEGIVNKKFNLTLICKRMDQDAVSDRLEQKGTLLKEFLTEVVSDWKGQRLVLINGGEPAAFSPEAFDFLMNVPGVALVAFNAYFKECGAKEKN